MKRTLGLLGAAVAIAIPLTAGGAGTVTASPVDYRAECETAYQAGKPVFDPLIANGKAATGPLEAALCGENRHS